MNAELFGLDAETIDLLIKLLPLVIPLAVIQFGLLIFAAFDIAKKKKTKNLNPVVWVLIVCLVNMIGPILYFVFGRTDAAVEDDNDDDENNDDNDDI